MISSGSSMITFSSGFGRGFLIGFGGSGLTAGFGRGLGSVLGRGFLIGFGGSGLTAGFGRGLGSVLGSGSLIGFGGSGLTSGSFSTAGVNSTGSSSPSKKSLTSSTASFTLSTVSSMASLARLASLRKNPWAVADAIKSPKTNKNFKFISVGKINNNKTKIELVCHHVLCVDIDV